MADELEVSGAQPGAEQAVVANEPAVEAPSLDDKLGAIYDKNNTGEDGEPRDPETGRFVARKDATGESDQELAASEDEADETTDQARQEGEDEGEPEQDFESESVTQPVVPAPNAWSEPMKAMWEVFPPEMQDFFAQREKEAHTTITRMGQELRQYRPLGKLNDDYRDVLSRHNVDLAKGASLLFEAQRRLDSNPVQAIQAIANQYGIDLAQLAGQYAAQAEAEAQLDPAVKATRDELLQIKRQLADRDQRERAAVDSQTRALQQRTDHSVDEWANDKPYYEEVRATMATLIAGGEADSLDEAYDMACNAKPSIRERILADMTRADRAEQESARAEEEEQRRGEARRHASEARRVQPVNSGTVRRAASMPSGKWDDDRNLERLYNRASQAR